MLVQLIVVVFAVSVSLVHTRQVVDTSAHRHAGLTEMQHAHTDPKTFEQRTTQGHFVVPKINQQQIRPVNSENKNYPLRTNQNSRTYNIRHESERNQDENVSIESQGSQFTVKSIKPRRIDDRAYNYGSTERSKKQLTAQQRQNKTRELNQDKNIYNQDNTIKSTSSAYNPSNRNDENRSLYQQNVREIVRTPIKFEQANDDYNSDRIVFIQDVNDDKTHYKDHENSIYNGVITPPTKLFTNKPSQTPKDSSTSTEGLDLEDRVAISGDKCPMGQTKIVGSDRCVKVDT